MMTEIVLSIPFLIVGLPIVLFAGQVALSLLPARKHDHLLSAPAPTTVVLVPAHNEAGAIGHTVARLVEHAEPETRIIVIADNCTDQTAEIARESGASVVERHDELERGKIFALRHGVAELIDEPPEALVVIDADCDVESDTVAGLARAAIAYRRPIQGLNLTDRYAAEDGGEGIAIFGNRVTNYVRPLGMDCIGLPCQLMGTGMAFPWELIKDFPIDVTRLAEDRQIGFDLAIRGATPRFVQSFA